MKLPLISTAFALFLQLVPAHAGQALNPDDYAFPLAHFSPMSPLQNADPSRGNILFINLNLNPKERKAVQNVADATGQNVVSFPDDQLMVDLAPVYLKYAKSCDRVFQLGKEISQLLIAIDAPRNHHALNLQKKMELRLQSLYDEINFETGEFQNALKKKAHLLALAHYQKSAVGPNLEANATEAFQNALNQLIAKATSDHLSFQTVVISGHHGQFFFGDLTLGFNENAEPRDRSYYPLMDHLKPLLGDVISLALWGCDTISSDSAAQWLLLSPKYQTLMGYSDTAPKGSRDSSSLFLEKGLLAGPDLALAANQADLQKRMDSIPGVENSAAAIVVRSPRLGAVMISTFIGDHLGSVVLKRKIEDLSETLQCVSLKNEIDETLKGIQSYWDGTRELPFDDTLSPLKRAYFFLHHHEKCFLASQHTPSSVYQIALLRFFDTDVKFNIASALSSQIKASQIELAQTPFSALQKFDFLQILNDQRRPAIVLAIAQASEAALGLNLPKTQALLKSLRKLAIELNDECMPFDLWHERSETPLTPSCPL